MAVFLEKSVSCWQNRQKIDWVQALSALTLPNLRSSCPPLPAVLCEPGQGGGLSFRVLISLGKESEELPLPP